MEFVTHIIRTHVQSCRYTDYYYLRRNLDARLRVKGGNGTKVVAVCNGLPALAPPYLSPGSMSDAPLPRYFLIRQQVRTCPNKVLQHCKRPAASRFFFIRNRTEHITASAWLSRIFSPLAFSGFLPASRFRSDSRPPTRG